MKRAVIFYSLSGNTKKAAKVIADKLQADLHEVSFVEPLPTTKFKQMMEGGRQATFGICPKINGMPSDVSMYDEIIIGTPIWASKCASPINTVLAVKEVADKVSAVFTFSGGGDNGKCIKLLKKSLPNMKHEVALCDERGKKAVDNERKLHAFLKEMRHIL